MLIRSAIAISTGLLLIVIAAWESSVIPHYVTECAKSAETGQQQCASYYTAFYIPWQIAKFVDDHSGTFSAIFAAAVAGFTWRLYVSTTDLANAERPILVPLNFKLTGIRDFSLAEVDFWFDFQNVGRTPAYLTKLHFGAEHHAGELPIGRPITESKDVFVIVGPTQFLSPAKDAGDIEIPAALKEAIIRKTTVLYIFGKIDFEEIGGTKHSQGFAVKFDPGEVEAGDRILNCGPRQYWTRS